MHLKRHHPGVTITVAVEKKKSCANPAHNTISTTPVWEFRHANAISKYIGVFIAADLRPFSVVDNRAVFLNFPLNYEPYRTVTEKPRYVPNCDFCAPLHPEYIYIYKEL